MSHSRCMTQAIKNSHCDHSCCYPCHFEIPSLLPPSRLPHYAYSIMLTHTYTHTQTAWLEYYHFRDNWTGQNYSRCMCYPFAVCIISVDDSYINRRGSISAVQEAAYVSSQLHTASLSSCRSVPFPTCATPIWGKTAPSHLSWLAALELCISYVGMYIHSKYTYNTSTVTRSHFALLHRKNPWTQCNW